MSLKGRNPAPTAPLLKNAALAPVIFFDNVPVFGALGGNVEIELAARLLMPKADGGVGADMTCTAHLRGSLQAAVLLREALDKAIKMATAKKPAPAADEIEDDDDVERSPLLS